AVTKVTSDGEPHAMMTMVAGLSGLLAAIIILAVLVSMVACRKHKTKKQQQQQQENNNRILSGAVAMTSVEVSQPQLAGNLNAAFAESTLNLGDDAKDAQQQSTAIIVERY
ncbi:hypothetical protein KR215_001337, partial [Drosophila sulfurigaster]